MSVRVIVSISVWASLSQSIDGFSRDWCGHHVTRDYFIFEFYLSPPFSPPQVHIDLLSKGTSIGLKYSEPD
jgi:hypothetical protein